MPEDMQIYIIGAGISGLVLGRCLLYRGIRATIFEKSRQSKNRNSYGITLHATSYRPLLQILGVGEDELRRKVAVDGVGKVEGGLRANRNRFESLLAEGVDIRWEKEVEGIETNETGVQVKLKDGQTVNSKVLVGADGPHSSVRQAILPDVDFKILPFAVYNGKRRVKTAEFESKLASSFGDGSVVEQKVGNSLFQVSINDKDQDEVSISYVFSRPAEDGEDALFRPKRSKSDATAVPEELFEEVGQLRSRLNEPLATVFDPQATRNDRLLNWLMRTIKIDSEQLEGSASKGIVLVGDAIHAEPILGGHGANEAIEDGINLAEILASGQIGGLRDFYEARKKFWSKDVDASEKRIREMHGEEAGRPTL